MGITYKCDKCDKTLEGEESNFALAGFTKSMMIAGLSFNIKMKSNGTKNPKAVICKQCFATGIKIVMEAMFKETFETLKEVVVEE